MRLRENILRALHSGERAVGTPIWELHFHLWGKMGMGEFVSGKPFLALSPKERQIALGKDAEIIARSADDMGMSAVSVPDAPWDCIYTLPCDDRLTLIRNLRLLQPDFLIVAGCGATISMPGDADAFMKMCYALMDDPDEIQRQSERILASGADSLKHLADAGADMVYSASDMADNRGPFFSPAQLRRYMWPYLRKWSDLARSLGLMPVLHTDGNVSPLLDDIVRSGVAGLQALDPVSGMTLSKARAVVGESIALCGNLDCSLMLSGTPEAIYENTLTLLNEDGFTGKMLLGCSNAVTIDTPVQNYMALLQAHRDWERTKTETPA